MNLIILFKEDFISDGKIEINGRRLNHIIKVHKAKLGDTLKVGILNGKMGTGLITFLSNKKIQMEVNLSEDPPKPLNIKLILAMPRPKVFNRIIQDITTLGVKEIYIIKTWRVDKSYWSSSVLYEESIFDNMILGLEQGKDTILPSIKIEKLFKPFVEDKIPEIIKDTKAYVAHPIAQSTCPRNVKEEITLAIGPEGGFIPYEIDMLISQGFESVSIGERILRVETAIQLILGRLK